MLENKAFILKGVLDTAFAVRSVPELNPDEVLVEVKKTGICGSDVHFYTEGRLGERLITSEPFALGHESSGIVVKVGEKVRNVHIGDRVTMEPGSACRICHECKGGRYNLCGDMIFPSAPPVDGTLQRYCKFPSENVYKLPDHLTLEDGAMMEPLSVAVHAVSNVGKLRTGQNVVVFGAGPIGLLCMAVARALGAGRIIAVDIVASRLEFALGYAATDSFLPPKQEEGESKMAYSKRAVETMKSEFGLGDRGAKSIDLVVDATGAETCIQMAILVAKIGGHLCPASSGKVDLKPIITHRFRFEDAIAAFETTRAGRSVGENGQVKNVIKTIISGPDVDPANV